MQEKLQQQVGIAKREFSVPEVDAELEQKVTEVCEAQIVEAVKLQDKQERYAALSANRERVQELLAEEFPEREGEIGSIIASVEKRVVRQMILQDRIRIDGRDMQTIRPISSEVGILPRAHGSALFTRGETQALVTTTLGTASDEQRIDNIQGMDFKKFMLHYNFPRSVWVRPVCVCSRGGVKLDMVCSQSALYPRFCLRLMISPTPSVLYLTSLNPMVPPPWLLYAAHRCL